MRIFLDNEDFRKFTYILSDVVEEFDLECWDFCVMHNHYHLCVCPRRWNFSEAIQKLNGEYGLWWNARHGRVGHVFQGRFKDQIVQAEGYLETLCRYIARNPARARLVKDPLNWKWSSCAALAGLAPSPSFLSTEHILSRFGETLAEQQAMYRQQVRTTAPGVDALDERFRSKARILGDAAFTRSVRQHAAAPREGDTLAAPQRGPSEPLIVIP